MMICWLSLFQGAGGSWLLRALFRPGHARLLRALSLSRCGCLLLLLAFRLPCSFLGDDGEDRCALAAAHTYEAFAFQRKGLGHRLVREPHIDGLLRSSRFNKPGPSQRDEVALERQPCDVEPLPV